MKRSILLLFLLLTTAAEAQVPRRVPLTGYVDRSGHVIEPAVWETGSLFFNGDWVVVARKGKSGYLNLRTHATTGTIFDGVGDANSDHVLFSHGPEPVQIGDKWGYADESGRIVIAPRFAGAGSYDADGLAIVQVRDPSSQGLLWGVIDRSGGIVIEPRYDMIRPFKGAVLTSARREGHFGAINRTGQEVIPFRFGGIGIFAANGLAPATILGGYGLDGGLWGYIDHTGHFKIPARFTFVDDFTVHQIDGGIAAPVGLARVSLKPSEGAYIDATGAIVTRFPPGMNVAGIGPNGLVGFQDTATARYGFADAKTAAIIIPARFSQAGSFDAHGLAAVRQAEHAGYIHADGQWAFPPRFTAASDFDALGQAQVSEEGRSELIDREGRVLATLTHGEVFYHWEGEFAAFRVFPGQEDAPPQHFWQVAARCNSIRCSGIAILRARPHGQH